GELVVVRVQDALHLVRCGDHEPDLHPALLTEIARQTFVGGVVRGSEQHLAPAHADRYDPPLLGECAGNTPDQLRGVTNLSQTDEGKAELVRKDLRQLGGGDDLPLDEKYPE